MREHLKHDVVDAKQLNSGCYAGRAGQVREMLHFIVSQSEFFRDDQQQFVRYAQSNPQPHIGNFLTLRMSDLLWIFRFYH